MRGRRGMATALLAALLSVLLVAACGSAQPSAATLARDAVRGFDAAPAKTIQGSFTDGVIPVSVKVTVGSNGDASGSGTFDHFPVKFLRSGGKTYVQGVAYWQWEHLPGTHTWPELGQQWVRTYADPATSAFQAASEADGSAATLKQQPAAMSAGSTVRVAHQWAVPLTYGSATYDVAAVAPHRLLLVSAPDAWAGHNLLSRTKLTIAYSSTTMKESTPGPGQYVDPGDPATLPARYTLAGVVADPPCDRRGCSVTERVRNDGGAPVGESLLTVSYYEDSDLITFLGSCQVAVPVIAPGGTADVKCDATEPALIAWTSQNQTWWWVTIRDAPYAS